ncbi:MAG: hypothetical protein E4H11_06960 [Myxococcales bacterium]|nr:MAG: hypothetical protein E4H11_06960 [Myxococcales bacterium]
MSRRHHRDPDRQRHHHGGFGNFLRNLLSGLPWSERAEEQETLRLDAPPGRLVRVQNANGRIRVLGEDRDDIEVLATKIGRAESDEAACALLREIRVLCGLVGGALEVEIDVPRRWNRSGHAHLELHVPRGTSVELSSSNGKICIENLCGAVRARSSNGSVDVTSVVGNIDVSASNAKVCCSHTQGHLVARSSNGKIQLEEHRGSIDASTSNGLIVAELEELGREGVQLATSNGRIILELPEAVDADVDIRVDNGVIRNDRELCKGTSERAGRLRGRLGNGGIPIRVRTSNGSVSLR